MQSKQIRKFQKEQKSLEDYAGIVINVQQIKKGVKDQKEFLYRDIELLSLDKNNYQKTYVIRLFNNEINHRVEKYDLAVFSKSRIFWNKINKVKLEFYRNESRLLIGDDKIMREKGDEYWQRIHEKQQRYINKQGGLYNYFAILH